MGILGAAVATAFAYLCYAVAVEIYFRIRLRRAMGI
jgi:Na+-driven multidrug efflux pump